MIKHFFIGGDIMIQGVNEIAKFYDMLKKEEKLKNKKNRVLTFDSSENFADILKKEEENLEKK